MYVIIVTQKISRQLVNFNYLLGDEIWKNTDLNAFIVEL